MFNENVDPIPGIYLDEKQITYFLTQNGIASPAHLKSFRVY